jgi:ribonucleoside-diphosphate reductase alpha chain
MRPAINQDLIVKRYAQNEENEWRQVAMRVARHGAGSSGRTGEFFAAIFNGLFFPSRMTYMGTDYPFASSCFVFPVEDSLAGIMKTLGDACQVQKYGGGTGYNFSHLRPKGSRIKTSGGEASGPVSFMRLFHNAMEVVNRAGKKHAAQMGILNCDHPDIFEFIQCKDVEGSFWTFNISVGVSDAFMSAVEKDGDWHLHFDSKVYRTLPARQLWDYICAHAHHNGDPGVIFLDTVNRLNCYPEPIEASNPCGEQMLPPYVSCNLGSIDLSRFVTQDQKIDWNDLDKTVRTGVGFLDGSLDSAIWPVEEVRVKTAKYRNIGLGVMGWADMLILMGIPYDSDAAVGLGGEVMGFVHNVADDESRVIGNGARKNVTVTSIAPTGSISMLAGCSSGIEPIFGVSVTKNTYVGSYRGLHWIFEGMARERGFYSEQLIEEVARRGSVQGLSEVPADVKALFKTANEINWEWHIAHQSVFQLHTDNAVSKTLNLPNSATVSDVAAAYQLAYKTGCKSTTVYRDGSRLVQVLDGKEIKRQMCPGCQAILFMSDGELTCVTCGYKPEVGSLPAVIPAKELVMAARKKERPPVLAGTTYRKETPLGKAYITINSNGDGPGDPMELFVFVGKAGSDIFALSEAIGRLISLQLRTPSPIPAQTRLLWVADELAGIGGGRTLGFGSNRVRSLPDGIAQVIVEHLDTVQMGGDLKPSEMVGSGLIGDICPECGEATLVYEEGCSKCTGCGYSAC